MRLWTRLYGIKWPPDLTKRIYFPPTLYGFHDDAPQIIYAINVESKIQSILADHGQEGVSLRIMSTRILTQSKETSQK